MTDYDAFVRDWLAAATSNPDDRVYSGLDRDIGDLDDVSLEAEARRVAEARALLVRLDDVAVPDDFDARLDADLMRLTLQRRVHAGTYTFNGRTRLQQLPDAAGKAGDAAFLIFVNDPRPATDRLLDVTTRMEQVPAMCEAMLARLETPVARWVEIDLEKIAELPDLFAALRGWAEQEGWHDASRLDVACGAAEQALNDYARRLRALPTTEQIHLDREDARAVVRLRGVERSLEELHALARDWLAATFAQIETLRERLVGKYGLPPETSTPQLHAFLDERFPVDIGDGPLERVLDHYRVARARIDAFIAERDLFEIPADEDIHILRTPGFMEPSIPAGAMMAPPPLREGTRRSLVYLTLKEAELAEHTEIGIPMMMVHEGIPGHHLQLASSAGHPSVVRRLFDGADWAEGWTTMLEDYMLDLGLMGELEDEARFCGKRDLSRIGARVAIDLFFMTGDRSLLDVGVECDLSDPDPFVAAGNLLEAVTGFTPGRVQSELNWNSTERGYPLSYLLGNDEVWKVKRELAERNVPGLTGLELDRAFHRAYLGAGNLPAAWLRRAMVGAGLLS